uniref:Uncharacterized protein n=1 Tax=Rhizophora mucronata TaxID=61149 RepID=A0A2P2Q617_RHIMU
MRFSIQPLLLDDSLSVLLDSFSEDQDFGGLHLLGDRECSRIYPATWSLDLHGLHSSVIVYPSDLVHAWLPVYGTHMSWSPLYTRARYPLVVRALWYGIILPASW